MASTLCVHSARFNAKHVTFDALKALPEPAVLGPHHKPVPHHVLIDGFRQEAQARNLVITREQFALGAKDAALFGVMDFDVDQTTALVPVESGPSGLSFGFRSANDLSLAIRAVAGARVFVCDNLALSGDMFAISRKHTQGLDLGAAIRAGFDKFMSQAFNLANQIASLNGRSLSDDEAKIAIYELFHQAVLPVKLFADVTSFYFEQSDERPDCLPRTAWGLHNAVTRAIKSLKPVPAFQRTVAVGKFFGLTGQEDKRVQDVPATALIME
jgi:hypothetical protein